MEQLETGLRTMIILGILYLLANGIYLLVFSLAGRFISQRKQKYAPGKEALDFLVLIPAYKGDEVILQSVETIKALGYNRGRMECVVIGDSLESSTVTAIKAMGAGVHEYSGGEKRSKAAAIQSFLKTRAVRDEICLLLDVDNQVEPDALNRAFPWFSSGTKVLQAARVAKNRNNGLALLDTISEAINNHIFRKGQRSLGFSASLIGSGLFIDMNLFRNVMQDMEVFSGFDKEMELRLLRDRIRIEYDPEIRIYDEKISAYKAFVTQRRRWLFAQIDFLVRNLPSAFRQLIRGNFDYVNKVIQFALLPRAINLGFSVLMLSVIPLFNGPMRFLPVWSLIFNILALCTALQGRFTGKELVRSLLEFPFAFLTMLFALVTSFKAKGRFLHTPHQRH